MVTKGSVLDKMPEAKGVVALARAIANREDSEAVFSVEESAFFGLTPADFTNMKMGGEDDELSARAHAARRVLARARRRIGKAPLSQLLADVLHESGWVARLEEEVRRDPDRRAENHAKLANALKVVRMAENIEEEHFCDAAFVASTLAARMENIGEPPGALSAKDSNFVRIMSIHASKGLQFPIVAVAEFAGGGGGDKFSRIVSERMADDRGKVWQCALLDAGASADEYEKISRKCRAEKTMFELVACEKEPISDERARRYVWPGEGQVADAAQFRAALVAHAHAAEAAELERKLYVAFTRAQEALIVCMKAKETKKNGLSIPAGVQTRIAEAHDRIEARWEYRFETVGSDDAGAAGEGGGADAAPDFLLPTEFARRPRGNWRYVDGRDADVFSASSLAALEEDGQADAAVSAPSKDAADAPRDAAETASARVPEPASAAGSDACAEAAPVAATVRGEALHACAQFAALHTAPGDPICALSQERLHSIAHAYGLRSKADIDELARRMDAWTGSKEARRIASYAQLRCEEPFFISLAADGADVAGGTGATTNAVPGAHAPYLRGFIDLLAYDEFGRGTAQVVDYKTGYLDKTPAERADHFTIQAECYALALLAQGFERVELSFVFLDDVDAAGQPQTVEFGPFAAEAGDDTARDADGAPCTRAWLYADLRERVARAACAEGEAGTARAQEGEAQVPPAGAGGTLSAAADAGFVCDFAETLPKNAR